MTQALGRWMPLPRHFVLVQTGTARPYRWRAECVLSSCGWAGESWRSDRLAEVEAQLHELANCPHDSIEAWGSDLWSCTVCGVRVTCEVVDGVVRIEATADE